MENENEEILEKLRDVKNTAEKDISASEEDKNEVVQNVKYYGTIELTRRDDGEKESFELYTVEIYDYEKAESFYIRSVGVTHADTSGNACVL